MGYLKGDIYTPTLSDTWRMKIHYSSPTGGGGGPGQQGAGQRGGGNRGMTERALKNIWRA